MNNKQVKTNHYNNKPARFWILINRLNLTNLDKIKQIYKHLSIKSPMYNSIHLNHKNKKNYKLHNSNSQLDYNHQMFNNSLKLCSKHHWKINPFSCKPALLRIVNLYNPAILIKLTSTCKWLNANLIFKQVLYNPAWDSNLAQMF